MEFVLSIVLLKMKSREKSRYCPFFDNNSAPSTSWQWQEVSGRSSEQTRDFEGNMECASGEEKAPNIMDTGA